MNIVMLTFSRKIEVQFAISLWFYEVADHNNHASEL